MKAKHIIAVAVTAFLFYVAADGPLFRLWAFGNTPETIRTGFEIAYTPLWWAADQWEPLDKAVSSYEIWWCEAW